MLRRLHNSVTQSNTCQFIHKDRTTKRFANPIKDYEEKCLETHSCDTDGAILRGLQNNNTQYLNIIFEQIRKHNGNINCLDQIISQNNQDDDNPPPKKRRKIFSIVSTKQ